MADPSAFIARAREVIAKATPGPVRAGRADMISYGVDDDRPYKNIYVGAATARRARNDVPDDLAKVWGVNCIADATLFALAVNAMPALVAVAEAAAALLDYHDRCRVESRYGDEMRKALAALAEVPQ